MAFLTIRGPTMFGATMVLVLLLWCNAMLLLWYSVLVERGLWRSKRLVSELLLKVEGHSQLAPRSRLWDWLPVSSLTVAQVL
jgi:hypothetical protein